MKELRKFTNEELLEEIDNRMESINNLTDTELINEVLDRSLERELLSEINADDVYYSLKSKYYNFLDDYSSEELLQEVLCRDDKYLIDHIRVKQVNNFDTEKLKRHLCDIVDVGYLTDKEIIMEKLMKLI